jgi:Holliday junction resolvase RusA-like endonuclease
MPHTVQTLTWVPRAKGRPRSTIRNGRILVFTDKATRDTETALAAQWAHPPVDGPISVHIELSDTQVKIEIDTVEPHTSKKLRGDCDNYLKVVLDALNGVAFHDDRQIVHLTGIKL